jgi:hypothetical protein
MALTGWRRFACLMRRKRSSSAAATSLPSTNSAAELSCSAGPVTPRMFIGVLLRLAWPKANPDP